MKIQNSTKLILGGVLFVIGAVVTLRKSKWYEEFVNVTARKPSGWLGKRLYKDPHGHYKSFELTLEKLQLKPDDYFLEVACGGGVLLEMALRMVKQAAAIDHSVDMVDLAGEANARAVADGRVEIVQGDAESLPWHADTFTCVASANAFFFYEHPAQILREIYRVLRPGGRVVIMTLGKATLAKVISGLWPLRVYADAEMDAILRQTGFDTVEVKTQWGTYQICYARKS
jgi:ubiquinone/menaquinone biosynthesis C-methylase UbiE